MNNNHHKNNPNSNECLLDALFNCLKFETYTEFCERADEILRNFKVAVMMPTFKIATYRNYIYNGHKFSNSIQRDMEAKDKIWLWVMSYKYEPMSKNDLYSTLGQLKKGK